jgi:hypothetical protein
MCKLRYPLPTTAPGSQVQEAKRILRRLEDAGVPVDKKERITDSNEPVLQVTLPSKEAKKYALVNDYLFPDPIK